ncbi:hypothetical protein HYR54_16950 [Candidatus Acetothermia bacterium]|nr:hypothetical protein [Candidatus Acetothermia bacterium]
MLFRDKVKNPAQGVILYEIIPPPEESSEASLGASLESLGELLDRAPIDGINIPEIRNENRNGTNINPYISKIEPRVYGHHVQKHLGASYEVIINRGIVYDPPQVHQQWLLQTWKKFEIRNLVLVGGESSQQRYPGPSLTQASEFITQCLNRGWKQGVRGDLVPTLCRTDYFCGGITIPTRRKPDPALDEPQRLIEKARHGFDFFTSQVIYEAKSTQQLLRDYDQRCRELGEKPRRIFLSFAPVSTAKDIAFLKWLGVQIPEEMERHILQGWIGTAWRSIKVSQQVLREILEFVRSENIEIPLGLNIEHIMKHNFEVSKEMIACLAEEYHAHVGLAKHRKEVQLWPRSTHS